MVADRFMIVLVIMFALVSAAVRVLPLSAKKMQYCRQVLEVNFKIRADQALESQIRRICGTKKRKTLGVHFAAGQKDIKSYTLSARKQASIPHLTRNMLPNH